MEEATIRQSKLVGRPEEEVCRRVRARLNQFAAEDRLAGQSDARRETCCNLKTRTRAKTKTTTTKIARRNAILCKLVFSFIIVNNILSNLMHLYHNQAHENYLKLPRIILAGAAECTSNSDCSRDRVCHEDKCICDRDRPIEDQDRCLPLALMGEQCSVSEQCLGNSQCVEGICSCGNDALSLFNPSTKIFYCHPKRGLNEECNYDSQCPTNSYCSTSKSGCLCHNGFAEAIVSVSGREVKECLAKICRTDSDCESEFHICEDEKCKCLASHFDPTIAKCYRFGSTGGKALGDLQNSGNSTDTVITHDDYNDIFKFFKDLTEKGDHMWIVLLILVILSLFIFILLFILLRKYYIWTSWKKEYEPNNKSAPKNGYFDKNSINNKSFRKKNQIEEDDEDADRSNLVTQSNDDQVRVNINDNQHRSGPLSTSTSTPV